MSKTVESYSLTLDSEIQSWNGFLNALRRDDREAFEKMMGAFRENASAASNANRPVLFEAMAMSILLYQQKMLDRLEKEINSLKKSILASL